MKRKKKKNQDFLASNHVLRIADLGFEAAEIKCVGSVGTLTVPLRRLGVTYQQIGITSWQVTTINQQFGIASQQSGSAGYVVTPDSP